MEYKVCLICQNKSFKGYWKDKRTSNYQNWTGRSEREPNRTSRNEKKVMMKLEISGDQTQLKKELGELEDGIKEITQNVVQRENNMENRKRIKRHRDYSKKIQHKPNWNSSRREREESTGNI